jgi:hypothetical protein
MDNKKFEKLIELIINENEEQARALFHDIVVEKSRQIYEDLMEEEDEDKKDDKDEDDKEKVDENMEMQDEGNEDEVGNLLDEIEYEHTGMNEEDEFSDIDSEDEIELDPDAKNDGNQTEHDIEDRVVDLEDKLDELMAEFEQMMGQHDDSESDEPGEENDFTDDSAQSNVDEEYTMESDDEEDKEKVEESVQLQKVPTVKHGDDGVNKTSPSLSKPGINGNGASAANLNKGYVDSGKGGTVKAPATIPGKYKNAPGSTFSEKGEKAPKPKFGDDGVNQKSVIESRKTTKKIVR